MQDEESRGIAEVSVRSYVDSQYNAQYLYFEMEGATHANVNVADVANNVVLAVEYGKGCYAFVVHQRQRVGKRSVAVDSQDVFHTDLQILQRLRVHCLCVGEILMILPEEAHKT